MKQKQRCKSANGWELFTRADGSLSCENSDLCPDDTDRIEELLKPLFLEKIKELHVHVSYDNWSGVFIDALPGFKSKKADKLIKDIYAFLADTD